MKTAKETANWTRLAEAAHRMKGSWLLIGLSEGVTLSQQLSERAKQHQDMTDEWNLLVSLTNRLLKKLDSYGSYPLT